MADFAEKARTWPKIASAAELAPLLRNVKPRRYRHYRYAADPPCPRKRLQSQLPVRRPSPRRPRRNLLGLQRTRLVRPAGRPAGRGPPNPVFQRQPPLPGTRRNGKSETAGPRTPAGAGTGRDSSPGSGAARPPASPDVDRRPRQSSLAGTGSGPRPAGGPSLPAVYGRPGSPRRRRAGLRPLRRRGGRDPAVGRDGGNPDQALGSPAPKSKSS